LQDLASVSVPYELSYGAEPRRVIGHQRQLDEKYVRDIKRYLEQSNNRLIPEVLSVRDVFNNAILHDAVTPI